LREAAGLTQQQLATNAGLSSSNLGQIEQGQKRDPRISTPRALARALGVSIDALNQGKKEKSDKELLQGTWVEESRGADAKKVAEGDRWKLVFDEDKVTWADKGEERKGTFTLDPDRKPKEIDLTFADPSLVLNGIYELKGDTLKSSQKFPEG
jgi:uncharacterized protein (TIGR03067 family)